MKDSTGWLPVSPLAKARTVMSRSVRVPMTRASWSHTGRNPIPSSRIRTAASSSVVSGEMQVTSVFIRSWHIMLLTPRRVEFRSEPKRFVRIHCACSAHSGLRLLHHPSAKARHQIRPGLSKTFTPRVNSKTRVAIAFVAPLFSRRIWHAAPNQFAVKSPTASTPGADENMYAPALLTDLYQLTMAHAYFKLGMRDTAVFELFVRR